MAKYIVRNETSDSLNAFPIGMLDVLKPVADWY